MAVTDDDLTAIARRTIIGEQNLDAFEQAIRSLSDDDLRRLSHILRSGFVRMEQSLWSSTVAGVADHSP